MWFVVCGDEWWGWLCLLYYLICKCINDLLTNLMLKKLLYLLNKNDSYFMIVFFQYNTRSLTGLVFGQQWEECSILFFLASDISCLYLKLQLKNFYIRGLNKLASSNWFLLKMLYMSLDEACNWSYYVVLFSISNVEDLLIPCVKVKKSICSG